MAAAGTTCRCGVVIQHGSEGNAAHECQLGTASSTITDGQVIHLRSNVDEVFIPHFDSEFSASLVQDTLTLPVSTSEPRIATESQADSPSESAQGSRSESDSDGEVQFLGITRRGSRYDADESRPETPERPRARIPTIAEDLRRMGREIVPITYPGTYRERLWMRPPPQRLNSNGVEERPTEEGHSEEYRSDLASYSTRSEMVLAMLRAYSAENSVSADDFAEMRAQRDAIIQNIEESNARRRAILLRTPPPPLLQVRIPRQEPPQPMVEEVPGHCPVCKNLYGVPKLLKCCGRSICEQCEATHFEPVRNRKRSKKHPMMIECPVCHVRTKKKQKLVVNVALKNAWASKVEPVTVECSSCHESRDSSFLFYCMTCGAEDRFCSSCGFKIHLGHEVEAVDATTGEIPQEKIAVRRPLPTCEAS
uniref:RING-type domain-containing protein n=1 Tax=Steinernema glaseri TaxID=37863 RepID=A0A1I7ZIL2_9BILA